MSASSWPGSSGESSPAGGQPRPDPRVGLGYNGQWHERGTGWQLLGNGHRAYNPVLLRFHSPDGLSPFGRGGINAYAYCAGDPINSADPDGEWPVAIFSLVRSGTMAAGRAVTSHGTAFVTQAFRMRTPQLLPVLAATAVGLGATGIALASSNEKQRILAVVGAVIAFTGASAGLRYAWNKRKPLPADSPAAHAASTSNPSPALNHSRSTALAVPSAPSRSTAGTGVQPGKKPRAPRRPEAGQGPEGGSPMRRPSSPRVADHLRHIRVHG